MNESSGNAGCFLGRDCELSTTGIDRQDQAIDPWDVSKAVIAEIEGTFAEFGRKTWIPSHGGWPSSGGYSSRYSTDCERRWPGNGQCYYVDCSHSEVCTAATRFPRTFAAQSISTLLVAERARCRAEENSDDGNRYMLSTAGVDMVDPGISWGAHINASVSTQLWEDLMHAPRRPAVLGATASILAAAIPYFGCGYLMPMRNGTTIYSLSGRAHHLSRIQTLATTIAFERGILNERRESHGTAHERLHLIGFDFSLASAALQASFLQCMVAALEQGYCGWNLYEPVHALRSWSWGLDLDRGRLAGTAQLVGGGKVTLPAYIRGVASDFLQMCETGLITEHDAPEATELLPLLIETTHHVEEGSFDRAARHLDWSAKLLSLTGLCEEQGLELGDPVTRLADHDFVDTDREKGAFWGLWEDGLIDPLISMDDAIACISDGPEESRDWGRGRIIQNYCDDISSVDWSVIEAPMQERIWGPKLRIEMPRLDSFNREDLESWLSEGRSLIDIETLLIGTRQGVAVRSDPILDIQPELADPEITDE